MAEVDVDAARRLVPHGPGHSRRRRPST
jgi:hypothetical protein